MSKCTCKTCEQWNKWQAALAPATAEAWNAFQEIYALVEAAEADLAVYRCIHDGTWPHAEDTLKAALKRVRAKKKAEQA